MDGSFPWGLFLGIKVIVGQRGGERHDGNQPV